MHSNFLLNTVELDIKKEGGGFSLGERTELHDNLVSKNNNEKAFLTTFYNSDRNSGTTENKKYIA